MRANEYLLSDEQIRDFVINGYLQVQTHLDDAVHHTIFEQTNRLLGQPTGRATGSPDNPQNNILPLVGELWKVLEAPQVVGALTSILGDGYVMLPHRHCHTNVPVAPLPDGNRGITMVPHRDGQAGCHKPRHRVPRWAILFYYPQECPDRQGPTALIPQTHLLPRLTTALDLEIPLAVVPEPVGGYRLPANYVHRRLTSLASGLGAVSMMHFDLGHSVLTNIAEKIRYGHKFVFMRTQEPRRPSWANRDLDWRSAADTEDGGGNEIAWTYIWNWMTGAEDLFRRAPDVPADPDSIAQLQRLLDSGVEADRLRATNGLGFARDAATPAIAALVRALDDDSPRVQLNAGYALGAVGAAAIDPLIAALEGYEDLYRAYPPYGIGHAAHALGAIGKPAAPALARALGSRHAHVRANAAYALGEMGHAASSALGALVAALDDPAAEVRRHLLSAISLVGHPQPEAVTALGDALQHEPDGQLRQLAIQGMMRVSGPQDAVVPVLAAALNDSDPYVAAYAGDQLCQIGTPPALAAATDHLRRLRWFPDAPRVGTAKARGKQQALAAGRVAGRR